MKEWRVHLHKTICGEITLEADTENDARKIALLSAPAEWVEWEAAGDIQVVDAVEVDEDGEEIE